MTLALPPAGADPRRVAETVNRILAGKINSAGIVTLTAGAGTTTVQNAFVSKSSVILFAARTANAAAIAEPYVTEANVTDGTSFVITHANNANADKEFSYVILG